ncbi:hypothetical protein T459_01653 [Capsicum annuum]|uniref:PX domain-containing protein n=1 Tax=Capsicum annuum TaxID=4072 RepID=A0A2G3AHP9_CAPAN|nr:hypothetical protein T459_01653 [Capsicum annuum]
MKGRVTKPKAEAKRKRKNKYQEPPEDAKLYKNFERLHRHLKDIPNYTLYLPPKRIFSSSAEDAFVHQRCVQLDKYLQDLLTIDNVADQHKVWDFLSASSKVILALVSPHTNT